MKKIVIYLAIVLSSLLICGCTILKDNKVVLEKEYYNSGGFIASNTKEVKKLLDNKKSFILFTYNNYCSLPFPCEKIFEKYMENNDIRFLSIPFKDFKELPLYETIKYAPTVVIINKGEVVSYLKADSDDDFDKYQNVDDFTEWIDEYLK